jgi:hypothetical protein
MQNLLHAPYQRRNLRIRYVVMYVVTSATGRDDTLEAHPREVLRNDGLRRAAGSLEFMDGRLTVA